MYTIKRFKFTDIILPYLPDSINVSSIYESWNKFPGTLKYADTTCGFKKENETGKKNYRPMSVLTSVSKTLEKISYVQIEKYMDNKLSSLSCGFFKKKSLFNLLQNCQENLDARKLTSTILIDLSKAYDSLPHDLLLAKLEAYGFSVQSL